MKRTIGLLRAVGEDQRGAGLIELGVAAPLIALVLVVSVDSARGFAKKLALEAAAARTIEKVTAKGQAGSDFSTMTAEAAAASGEPASNVVLDKWLECDRVRKTNFTDTCADGEEMGRYLSIRITGTFRPMFNTDSMARMYGGRGMGSSVAVVGNALVRLQ